MCLLFMCVKIFLSIKGFSIGRVDSASTSYECMQTVAARATTLDHCHVWFETTLLPLSHSGFPVRFNSVTASSVNNITPKLEQLNIIQPSLTVCVGFLGLFFSTRIFPFVSHYKNNYNNYFW